MDINAYWQENKRFLLAVAGGFVLFLVAWMVMGSMLRDKLDAQQARAQRLRRDLGGAMYGNAELEAAQADNQALRAVVADLRDAVSFRPRENFLVPAGASAANRYIETVYATREDLLSRSGRAGLSLPGDLGLPALAPTREVEIARHLEALDLVDRTVRKAIAARVQRIDEIRIKLDPRLSAGKPVDDLEKTVVELKLTGPSQPLVRLVELLQEPGGDGPVLVERVDVQSARLKRDDVRMELTLLVAHPHGLGALPEEGDSGAAAKGGRTRR